MIKFVKAIDLTTVINVGGIHYVTFLDSTLAIRCFTRIKATSITIISKYNKHITHPSLGVV